MSQKIENILNLAFEATPEERARSAELDVGYDAGERAWDLIIKYSGSLDAAREISESVTELLNNYAVVRIREDRIEALASLPEVEFVEKPKSLYFQADVGRQVSCIDAVQEAPYGLTGQGVLVGIVDSGIDLTNADFRNEDGTTRIAALWDQADREFTSEEINEFLNAQGSERPAVRPPLSVDSSGHGTAVAGIAAGNGRGSEGRRYRGAAPESELVIVKMKSPQPGGFPRTTELMTGVDYLIRKAQEMRMPVAVNISFGNTYGPHDGSSLVEQYLNDVSAIWKNVICIGTGNEGTAAGHAAGIVSDEEETVQELAVQEREQPFGLQIWKSYTDEIDISIISPAGEQAGPFREKTGAQRYLTGSTELLVYYGEPKPYSVRQEIFIAFLPMRDYVDSGVWQIVLTPRLIVAGTYQMWLPAQAALNVGTAFLTPDGMSTLTVPSTAARVVTVAAYDARTFSYADFSGRGPSAVYESAGVPKPDVAAPGVDVNAPVPGGGYRAFTGTSFAVPFAAGGAALLMEWGIVRGNDPYLYGEKVKAYLRRGARQLPGYRKWPNAQLGYGALCVRDSLPDR
ncbi:MAG TPA: S8 family serine peptidase [Candidatus Mediterraneibacter guildfordensis]|nr:S8 family serine peptidase [Candidatus Mediterraneibacter guildfordensis]